MVGLRRAVGVSKVPQLIRMQMPPLSAEKSAQARTTNFLGGLTSSTTRSRSGPITLSSTSDSTGFSLSRNLPNGTSCHIGLLSALQHSHPIPETTALASTIPTISHPKRSLVSFHLHLHLLNLFPRLFARGKSGGKGLESFVLMIESSITSNDNSTPCNTCKIKIRRKKGEILILSKEEKREWSESRTKCPNSETASANSDDLLRRESGSRVVLGHSGRPLKSTGHSDDSGEARVREGRDS